MNSPRTKAARIHPGRRVEQRSPLDPPENVLSCPSRVLLPTPRASAATAHPRPTRIPHSETDLPTGPPHARTFHDFLQGHSCALSCPLATCAPTLAASA